MPPRSKKAAAKTVQSAQATPARRVTRSALREGSAEPLVAPTFDPPKRQRKSTRSRSNSVQSYTAPPSITTASNSAESEDGYQPEILPSLPEQEEDLAVQLQLAREETASLASFAVEEPMPVARHTLLHEESVAEEEQTGTFGLSSHQLAFPAFNETASSEDAVEPVSAPHDSPQRTPQRTPQTSPQKTSPKPPQQASQTTPQQTSQESPQTALQQTAQKTPKTTPKQRARKTPRTSSSPFDFLHYRVPTPNYSPLVASPPFLMERFLSESASLLYELTALDRTALVLALRAEVLRLRRQVEEKKAPSPDSSPVWNSTRGGMNNGMSNGVNMGMNNLRYRFTIAQPVAEAAAAARAAAAAQQNEIAVHRPSSSSAPAKSSPAKTSPTKSSPARSSPTNMSSAQPSSPMHSTPKQQMLPPASSSASPSPASWGLTSLFGTVKRALVGPGRNDSSSPEKITSSESAQSQRQSSSTSQRRSPTTPSRQQRTTPRHKTPKTPTPVEPTVDESPVRTERRRGTLPGSVRASRKTPAKTPGRTPGAPPKPVEPNADRRYEQMQQAAERKRIQEEAEKIEEEKRQTEEEQKRLDEADAARQEIGNKRKRVRVDDLKHIPAARPGQTGTFGLLDEFFDQNSDSDEDDYVEMDVDDIELFTPRPNKKMRLDENVFVPASPAKQNPAAATPATPVPNYARIQEEAVERQRLLATQHKPRRPSGLRQMSTGSPNNGTTLAPSPGMQLPDTPQIVSSSPFYTQPNTPSAPPVTTPMPPSPAWFEVPNTVLSNITEVTEPETPVTWLGNAHAHGRTPFMDSQAACTPMSTTSEHPELLNSITTPTPSAQVSHLGSTSLGVSPPVSSPTPSELAILDEIELDLNWPSAVDFWPRSMDLIERLPITAEEQAESDRRFNAGVADRLYREQNGLASTIEITGF